MPINWISGHKTQHIYPLMGFYLFIYILNSVVELRKFEYKMFLRQYACIHAIA